MKLIVKQSNRKAAFTIVELLAVMSIIILLISLLAPALNAVKRYARDVRQKAQFHAIEVALNVFNAEFDGYPQSGELGANGQPYCGAMKLAEAMMGVDMLGFHPMSSFTSDNMSLTPPELYRPGTENERKQPYLELENANPYKIGDVYLDPTTQNFNDPCSIMLCDVYPIIQNTATGRRSGMPILYYRAEASRNLHNFNEPNSSIYNYTDNDALLKLKAKGHAEPNHPMVSGNLNVPGPVIFYDKTWNPRITTVNRPHRQDSFILLSAGNDGIYGTGDDIFNFERY